MRLEEQYNELILLKERVNSELNNMDFESRKKMVRVFDEDDMFNKLKLKDTQIGILNRLIKIWINEKTNPWCVQAGFDILNGVSSLEIAEEKYHSIEFGLLRLENGVPDEFLEDYINYLKDSNISGIAIAEILIQETVDQEENILRVVHLLKGCSAFVILISFLECIINTKYVTNNIVVELADVYLTIQCYREAKNTLLKYENPNEEIMSLISDLEKIAGE